jgi:hypothetical protein
LPHTAEYPAIVLFPIIFRGHILQTAPVETKTNKLALHPATTTSTCQHKVIEDDFYFQSDLRNRKQSTCTKGEESN